MPPDDPRSNRRMALEALLDHAPVPPGSVHPVPVDRPDVAACAAAYDAELRALQAERGPARPLLDVTFLGIGPDGHTASLFPGTPALAETRRLAVDNPPGLDPFVPRITLTFPALASSGAIAFLVSGADKRDALRKILEGRDLAGQDLAGQTLPAARVTARGPVTWFVDEAAMG